MEIHFKAFQDGVRYYVVIVNGQELFCGSIGECRRYIVIHLQKVAGEGGRAQQPLQRTKP